MENYFFVEGRKVAEDALKNIRTKNGRNSNEKSLNDDNESMH